MMSLWDALRMNMMISYQELVRTFLNIIINNTRKIIPPGKVFTLRGGTLNINIPGRSALLLGKTGEPPNYLYL